MVCCIVVREMPGSTAIRKRSRRLSTCSSFIIHCCVSREDVSGLCILLRGPQVSCVVHGGCCVRIFLLAIFCPLHTSDVKEYQRAQKEHTYRNAGVGNIKNG